MKVLMVVSNLRPSNGVASFAMNYFRSLNESKIQMDFALYNDIETPYYDEIQAKGSKIHILPSIKEYGKHVAECRKILNEGNYDIVHDNSLIVTLPLMAESKKAQVPIRILHSHATKMGETRGKEFRNRMLLPLLKSNINTYFACSNMAGKAMFGDKKFYFVPNVISSDVFHYDHTMREMVRMKMGVSENEHIIATVGRVAYQKNPFFVVDVITSYLRLYEDAQFWWIGSGPLQNELENYIEKKGMKEKILMLGSRNDVKDLYQAIDVFFLPSIFEGLPLTGVEAQAMGLPSVVSDSITNEMIYTDLVKMVSLKEPEEKWISALHSQASIHNNRDYTKELLNSCFSAEGAGTRLLELYESLLL